MNVSSLYPSFDSSVFPVVLLMLSPRKINKNNYIVIFRLLCHSLSLSIGKDPGLSPGSLSIGYVKQWFYIITYSK